MIKNTLDIAAIKIQELVEKEYLYEYPYFLMRLRKTLGRTKQSVCYDLDMKYDVLLRMEQGRVRRVDMKNIEMIAEYYGVPSKMLRDKCLQWIKKCKLKDGNEIHYSETTDSSRKT
jgi:hypothetical protein